MKSANVVPSLPTASSAAVSSAAMAPAARALRSTRFGAGSGETLALTLLVPFGVAWLAPHDPLLLDASFPWLSLVPLLLGAQHGALAGALSAALLAAFGLALAELGAGPELPRLAAFAGGCLASGVLAGFFRDRVRARLLSLEQQAREATRKLSRLGRAHVVLELSHRRLEERLAARSWSIAGAFRDAQKALSGGASLATVGDVVLAVLANHAMVQSATLLGATPGKGGKYVLAPSTSRGEPAAVDLDHRLIRRALETGRLAALDGDSVDLDANESIVAVAPLRSVSGRLLGLVLIHEMPFMAFQAENLENIAALAALLADVLEDRFLDAAREERAALAPADVEDVEDVAVAAVAEPAAPLAADRGGDETPRSGVTSRRGRGFVGNRTGTHRRRRLAQSA